MLHNFFKQLNKIGWIIFLLIVLQILVNLVGVLGPELSFDALWYHLTIPKIYLLNHQIFYIPGNLLYYSAMPKLVELLYMGALSLQGEILAKLIHFFFGIGTLIMIYRTSRKLYSPFLSLFAAAVFYSSLVVGWESISALVDLGSAFFEICALYFFLEYAKSNSIKNLLKTAIFVGLAVCTKLLDLGSIIIFSSLMGFIGFNNKDKFEQILRQLFVFILVSLIIPLPFFIFSFINTGNFVYPFFSNALSIQQNQNIFDPIVLVQRFINLFLYADDPISPIFLLSLIILPFVFKRFNKIERLLSLYVVLALGYWYVLPDIGGGRFILPYLAGFSILSVAVFNRIPNKKSQMILYASIILALVSSIVFRAGANAKYIPYILGEETKQEFLTKHLNFSFGDFYDTDGYFAKHIKQTDRVLLFGFHNLYYIDFPFIDSSWVKKGDEFNYIAVQHGALPERFKEFEQIYQNKTTGVTLYYDSGRIWHY